MKKQYFTLIEHIMLIVVIGILATIALPKFNVVIKDGKVSAMVNDKKVLEKTLEIYYEKYHKLPLLNEEEDLIIVNEGISLSKIVLAEEVESNDMETIYTSLKETLNHYNDSEESLYRINLHKVKNSLSENIRYGHKQSDKDFYVYSINTGNVYYYNYLINGNGTIQHSEYDTLLESSELVNKVNSPLLNNIDDILNNKPIVELTTTLEEITDDSVIEWEYRFTDEDEKPIKISFILNDVEYDSFDKIPTRLDSGNYTLRLKMQDSKGLWSNEVVENFKVLRKIIISNNTIDLEDTPSEKIDNF